MRNQNQLLGIKGEGLACQFLIEQGYAITDRNYRCTAGEIDIVAFEGETLVFIEVKTRRSFAFGTPSEAVTAKKQAKYYKIAMYYIKERGCQGRALRFDIIEVFLRSTGSVEINHIPHAYSAKYPRYYF